MIALPQLLASPWVQALGWTLLHFLWEGALIGLIASILFRFTRRTGAEARYLLACALLGLCVAAPLASFAVISAPLWRIGLHVSITPASLTKAGSVSSIQHQASDGPTASATVPLNAPSVAVEYVNVIDGKSLSFAHGHLQEDANSVVRWLVPFWLVGVVVMGLRLGADWTRIQYWRWTSAPAVDAAIISLMERLSEKMKFARRVTLLVCDHVRVPSVLGWLRPCILVPTHLLTSTTAPSWR